MKTYVARFLPDQDLMQELKKIVEKNNIKAGCIVSCLGSLKKANLRMPGGKTFEQFEGKYEILCLNGTLSINGCHLHLAMSEFPNGNVCGGHVTEKGCIINTTVEVVIAELENLVFERKLDNLTGFEELHIKKF